MRPRFLLAAGLVLAALLTGLFTLQSFSGASSRHAAGQREEESLNDPADALLARDLFGADRNVDTGAFWSAAVAQATQLGATTKSVDPAAYKVPWQLVGPTSVGGRVLDVVVDPKHADTIFIATASGGVWKSTDAGTTFTSAWRNDLTQSIGALAIAPDGTLYAGTGEAGPGGGSITYGGTGVYKSSDSGVHWKYIGLSDTSRIGRVVVDPKDPNRIFVAGTGPLYRHGGGRGLYLSEDAGSTWTKVLSGDNDTAGAVDVAIDPRDSKTVYAAMWDNFREPDKRTYEGLGSGLYKSTDAGKTWARIGTPFFGPRPDVGRIGVAVAPDGTLYGNVTGASGVYNGFYKSTDGGTTFSTGQPPTNPEDSFFVYGWWFGRIYVDPQDSNHVYQASLVLQESKNGGQSWAGIPGGSSGSNATGHADNHAMAWDPKVPGRVYVGNDGGLFRSDDNGTTSNWHKAKVMPFSQVNGIDVSEQDPTRIAVGLQDNGTNKNWNRSTDSGTAPPDDRWIDYTGGDGQRSRIAPDDKNLIYGCSQYGVCSVSTNGGTTTSDAGYTTGETGSPPGTRWNWFTPIEFDPQDSHTVYSGSELLSVSTDDGANFTPISPVLSGPPGRETNPLFRNYATITTIAPAGKSTGTIYAGTDDGRLWFTHDDGSTWTQASDPDLPTAWITRVEVDHSNPNRAFVTYSGFRQDDNAAYILETTDGGQSWTDITRNLPKAPVNDINIINNNLVVATDVGVFFRPAGRNGWLRLGTGLPQAPVYELKYVPASDSVPSPLLFAGTFGRSAFKIDASALN